MSRDEARPAALDWPALVAEKDRLLHELQVHQVELEVQNQSLRELHATLEASRSRYAELYDFAPVAYFTFDPKGCIVEVNLTGASMIGEDRNQLVGAPFVGLVRIQDPAAFWSLLRHCAATRAPATAELEFGLTRAGPIHVQAVATPVLDERGEPTAFRAAFHDITVRTQAIEAAEQARRAEEALRAQLEAVDRAALAIANELAAAETDPHRVPCAIVNEAAALTHAEFAVLRADGVVTCCPARPGAEGLMAAVEPVAPLREADVRAHPAFAGFPAVHPAVGALLVTPVTAGELRVGTLLAANKRNGQAFSDWDERSLEMLADRIGFALEVTRLHGEQARDRDRLELLGEAGRALASSLNRNVLAEAAARAAVPRFAELAMTFLNGDRLNAVAAVHRDAGVDTGALLQLPGTGLLAGRAPRLLARLAPGEGPLIQHVAGHLGLDSIIVAPMVIHDQLLGAMLFASGGDHRRYDSLDLAIAEEVAYRAGLAVENARLYQTAQAAVASRDNVMAMVSHDLRNPLNGILLNLAVLLAPRPDGERRRGRRQLEQAKASAEQLNRLVEDLLAATTLEAGGFTLTRKPEQVHTLLTDALASFEASAAQRGITLALNASPGLPDVDCDRSRVLQVFGNLLSNAIKVTPRGGVIRISAAQAGAFVRCCVSDDGPGIAADKIPHLFQRFWKDEQHGGPGNGLGLYIVKGIIDRHGGALSVEGAKGATFCFTLPIATAR